MQTPPDPEKGIPREFHSEYEERPFQNCSRCGEALDAFSNYQINKAYRKGECVFEYCFCEVCRDALLDEFSEESKENLMRYQSEHMKHDASGTMQCAFCAVQREAIPQQDFVITMLGAGLALLDSLLICETCQMEMHELLSVKTRDVRRRFFEELPGVPPDWEVWSPEEMERHKQIQSTKTKGPILKPELVGKGRPVPHLADDGCMELVWEVRPTPVRIVLPVG